MKRAAFLFLSLTLLLPAVSATRLTAEDALRILQRASGPTTVA